jgi:hypothetical protein
MLAVLYACEIGCPTPIGLVIHVSHSVCGSYQLVY